MTDEELADQMVRAAEQVLVRFVENPAKSPEELNRLLVAEFLTGAAQMANFLVVSEGEVTAQQAERALKIAGERIGL